MSEPVLVTERLRTVSNYRSHIKPIWCPGCGDFSVLNSVYKALAELDLPPEKVAIASGIGCSGRFPDFVKAYGFHGTHGRTLPLATGIKIGAPDLTVFAIGGDGDAFSIGGGHLAHAARRNVDLTYLVLDNEIYGLTKGQPSPTSPLGMEKKAAPFGTIDAPLNPIAIVLAASGTFVARAFSSRPRQLVDLIKRGVCHKGFSFIQVLSPCVTFNDTYAYFKEKTTDIPPDHDVTDKRRAMELVLSEDPLYLGVFYEVEGVAYDRRLAEIRARAGEGFSLQKLLERFRC
jgi:2-oxoglutarate ferredoxin oxidoreductase subunit beta